MFILPVCGELTTDHYKIVTLNINMTLFTCKIKFFFTIHTSNHTRKYNIYAFVGTNIQRGSQRICNLRWLMLVLLNIRVLTAYKLLKLYTYYIRKYNFVFKFYENNINVIFSIIC